MLGIFTINADIFFPISVDIYKAFLQKVTHVVECVIAGRSWERMVPVSVPLKWTRQQVQLVDGVIRLPDTWTTVHIWNHTFLAWKVFSIWNKSTPSRSILIPLPRANIYHRLKVHLLIHQGFGDLCGLLEMDVVYRKDSALDYVTER